MKNQKVLITGATGQLAFSIAKNLAEQNNVHAVARFGRPGSKEKLESEGIKCIVFDYVEDDLNQLDGDYDYVLHFATTQVPGSYDFDHAIDVNAVATGRLMYHFQNVKVFFFSSTCSVYSTDTSSPKKESDPLGDSMRGFCPTYSFSKVAAEAVVKFNSQQFDIPAVIARMNVSYGQNGGLPVIHLESLRKGEPIYLHPDKPNYYSPIHEQDYFDIMLKLLEKASSPALTVNWCGSELVSAEEWCEYMADLLGVEPNFVYTDTMIPASPADPSYMHELAGQTRVCWKDGFRELVEQGAIDGH